MRLELDPSQERAVDLVCEEPFGIVTGGPGTGKSTCLREALNRLDREGVTYALASPTGKAARRMSEATGRKACTIHRLLYWTRDGFAFNAENPLEQEVIIIDEASMLDVELGASLVAALRPDARLILVGDANQLPSVGPGRVLADLVESDTVPVARLTHVHRAAAESWICRNAPRVLEGAELELEACPDFAFFPAADAEQASRVVSDIITRPDFVGAQVLSPQRTTACGVERLNVALQEKLNPRRDSAGEWKFEDHVLRRGDRVIQTVNAYKLEAITGELGVFNGEVGTVVDVDAKRLLVNFGDRQVPYTRDAALALDLAYALTVHKSQGSEFGWVVCVVHSAHAFMLTRQLFYTAITRAKKGVIIVGNEQGLKIATSDKLPPKRNTTLIQRMRECALEACSPGEVL